MHFMPYLCNLLKNMSEESFYTFLYMRNLFFPFIDLKNERKSRWQPYKCKTAHVGSPYSAT